MIVSFENLSNIREENASKSIVFMGGCFDIMHEGHITGMNYCKSMGDLLVIGVSPDERVKQRKGPSRPIRSEMGRLILVDAIRPVDYSFLMPMPQEESPTLQVISHLRPDIFVDQKTNWSRWTDALSQIRGLGTQVIFNESPVLDSTTQIIQRVLESEQ